MSLREAAKLAGVSTATMRDRRPALLDAGAVQVNPTRWHVTPRHMEAAGIITIRQPKPEPEADPLAAAQARREAERAEAAEREARAAERAEVRRESPAREESAGTPPAGRAQREALAAAAYAAALAGDDARAVPAPSADGETAALRAELAEARHALEMAEKSRELAEARAAARAWEDRANTFELLATERGQMIAVLQAMLGGSAAVTRALDA